MSKLLKETRVSLSNKELAAAALSLVDRDGIEALSFRKLSDETGVPTMTIMNRFGSKDALLKAALEVMLAENEIESIEAETWQESLRRIARLNRAMAIRHPKGFMLFVLIPMFESPVLEYTQRVFAIHDAQNLPPEMPAVFLSLMHSFLSGFQLAETYANYERDHAEGSASPDVMKTFDLFTEKTFDRNIEIILAGFEAKYGLPKESGY